MFLFNYEESGKAHALGLTNVPLQRRTPVHCVLGVGPQGTRPTRDTWVGRGNGPVVEKLGSRLRAQGQGNELGPSCWKWPLKKLGHEEQTTRRSRTRVARVQKGPWRLMSVRCDLPPWHFTCLLFRGLRFVLWLATYRYRVLPACNPSEGSCPLWIPLSDHRSTRLAQASCRMNALQSVCPSPHYSVKLAAAAASPSLWWQWWWLICPPKSWLLMELIRFGSSN